MASVRRKSLMEAQQGGRTGRQGVGDFLLGFSKGLEPQETKNLEMEQIICAISGGTWNEEAGVCDTPLSSQPTQGTTGTTGSTPVRLGAPTPGSGWRRT